MKRRRPALFAVSVIVAVLAAIATAPGLSEAREFTSDWWRALCSKASDVIQPAQHARAVRPGR